MTAKRADVSAWLRDQTPAHLELLDKMRRRLSTDFPAAGVPDRDWCRVYGLYQQGYHALLSEERERARLALLAARSGQATPLTDEEYEREMRMLGLEAAKELPTADLATELAARGVVVSKEVSSGE